MLASGLSIIGVIMMILIGFFSAANRKRRQ